MAFEELIGVNSKKIILCEAGDFRSRVVEHSIMVVYAVAWMDNMLPMFREIYCSRLQRWVGSKFFYKVGNL